MMEARRSEEEDSIHAVDQCDLGKMRGGKWLVMDSFKLSVKNLCRRCRRIFSLNENNTFTEKRGHPDNEEEERDSVPFACLSLCRRIKQRASCLLHDQLF